MPWQTCRKATPVEKVVQLLKAKMEENMLLASEIKKMGKDIVVHTHGIVVIVVVVVVVVVKSNFSRGNSI